MKCLDDVPLRDVEYNKLNPKTMTQLNYFYIKYIYFKFYM